MTEALELNMKEMLKRFLRRDSWRLQTSNENSFVLSRRANLRKRDVALAKATKAVTHLTDDAHQAHLRKKVLADAHRKMDRD